MKLMTFFLMVIFLQASAGTYSQNITISLKNVSVEKVFKEIQKQSDYQFFYNEKLIKNAKKISINVKDATVQTVLQLCFKEQPFTYAIDNKQIIIKAKEIIKIDAKVSNTVTLLVDVSGQVKDAEGKPLAGATIKIKGFDRTTIADEDGKFSLSSTESSGILQISFVGFETREIRFSPGAAVIVSLQRKEAKVEELVVVGYGTQKKVNVTGSVATVEGRSIQKAAVGNITNALAGNLPGLIAIQRGGQPGYDKADFNIRGFGNALVIVDGIQQSFDNIDANEIESISILKDASAAIYGARGGNGVVLVTTKRGTIGKPKFSFDARLGTQHPTRYPSLVDAATYAKMFNDGEIAQGRPVKYTDVEIEKFSNGTDPAYPNTNWYDQTFRSAAPMMQYNLNTSGGSEYIKYFTSFGYLDQQGLLR